MIKYYYRNLHSKQLETSTDYKAGCWVNVQKPNEQEIEELVKRFKLDPGHLQDALDPDEMPRLEKEGDLSYIFVRYAETSKGLELRTVPLLFIVGPNILITMTNGALPRIERFTSGQLDFATTQHTKLLLIMLSQLFDQYDIYVNNLGKQINAIRSRLKVHEIGNQDFINFVVIEDELNDFLSALQPTKAMLSRLLLGRYVKLFDDDQDLIEDLVLNNEQSIEGCRASIKSIASIRGAYTTISSNNINRTMKILTAATVMITLPNVIFGMYGMNINLPFQDHPFAYLAILLVSVIFGALVFAIARKKRIF